MKMILIVSMALAAMATNVLAESAGDHAPRHQSAPQAIFSMPLAPMSSYAQQQVGRQNQTAGEPVELRKGTNKWSVRVRGKSRN